MNDKYEMFIPTDEKIAEDYRRFKIKLFRTVPKNTELLCINVFTGKPITLGTGFKFIWPWYKTKLVSKAAKNIDYPKEAYKTKDGIRVTVDSALTVKIADIEKFEYENADPIQELGVLTKDVLRKFIADKDMDELIKNKYGLAAIAVEDNRFADFCTKYGVEVSEIYFKNIDIPKSMEDDLEKQKVQQLENERALLAAKNAYEVAQTNAKTRVIEGTANADVDAIRIRKAIEVLDEKTADEKTKYEFLKTLILSSSNANLVASLGNSTNDLTTSIISALKSVEKKPTETTQVAAPSEQTTEHVAETTNNEEPSVVDERPIIAAIANKDDTTFIREGTPEAEEYLKQQEKATSSVKVKVRKK